MRIKVLTSWLLRSILALPFFYSLVVKFRDIDYYQLQIGISPVVPHFAKSASFFFPVFDAFAFIFLLTSNSKRPLIFSLALYIFYTIFLFSVSYYAWQNNTDPCGCQGLFTFLSIPQHIIVNLVLIILNALLIKYHR